jgi:type II secretion system protein N
MAVKLPTLGPRTRKLLRYVGLTVFALVTFVFALQWTFPYGRVKDKVVEALNDKYEVTIGGVERGIMPGRVYFTAVTLRTRQTKPAETVTTFFIKKLELDAGVLSLLGGTISVDVNAEIGAGTLSGSLSVGKFGRGDIHAHFVGEHLPGDALPMRGVLGLPMTGKIEFDVALGLPMEKSKSGKTAINWQKASGSFALSCPSGCTFGDGVTKLKPLLKNSRNQVMVGEGIDFGKVTMESLVAKATIKKGKLTVDKFETKSNDGELHVDYMMNLEKEFGESQVTGCLRFKGSDDLLKREPKTYAAIQTTGAELRSDGLFHILLTGDFKDMKRLNKECGPNGSVDDHDDDRGRGDRGRPNLTFQPERPPAGSAVAAPPPTPPSPTPPAPTPMEAPPSPGSHDAGATPGSNGAAINPATGGPTPPPPTGTNPPPPSTEGAEPPNEAVPPTEGAPVEGAAPPAMSNEPPHDRRIE